MNELRLLDLFWSEELLAEARRSLVAKKGLSGEVAQRWVDYPPQRFPAGYTDLDEVPTAVDLGSLAAIERAGAPSLAERARRSLSS